MKVTDVLKDKYGNHYAESGQVNTCPFCNQTTFTINVPDTYGKCYNPRCKKSISARSEDLI